MAQALRIVSVERGHDPQEFSLIAFGGAGPVHAAFLADELGIPEVIVPPAPGAFSALGLVATDLRRDYARTLYADLAILAPERLADALAAMEHEAGLMLHAAGVPVAQRELERSADVRYRRQAYELTVPLPSGAVTQASLVAMAEAFHAKHTQTYGHANEAEPVQLVNLRVTARGRLPSIALAQQSDPAKARTRERVAWFEETGFAPCPVHWREGLLPGARLRGPAIVEALDSTVVLPPGWEAAADERGFIRMRRT